MSSQKALENARWLFFGGFLQKILVFSVNQACLIWATPEDLGKALVQLELWLSTTLFLSREGTRVACIRSPPESNEFSDRNLIQRINITFLPFLISLLVSFLLFFIKNHLFSDESSIESSQFTKLLAAYSLASLIECLAEPYYIFFEYKQNVKPKMMAESTALLSKSIVSFLFISYFKYGVWSYALGQLAFSITYTTVFLFYHSFVVFLPKIYLNSKEKKELLNRDLLTSIYTISRNNLLKHFLTESDKIALSFLPLTDRLRGAYALSSAYGAIVVRLALRPLEESIRTSFALTSASLRLEFDKDDSVKNRSDLDQSIISSTSYIEIKKLLFKSLHLILFFTLFIIVYGPVFVCFLTEVFLRPQWRTREVKDTLELFFFYIPCLGINGITEGFLHTTIPESMYKKLNNGYIYSFFFFYFFLLIINSPLLSLSIIFSKISTSLEYFQGISASLMSFSLLLDNMHTYVLKFFSLSDSSSSAPAILNSSIVLANIFSMFVRILWNVNLINKLFSSPQLFLNPKSRQDQIHNKSKKFNLFYELLPSISWLVLIGWMTISTRLSYFMNISRFYADNSTENDSLLPSINKKNLYLHIILCIFSGLVSLLILYFYLIDNELRSTISSKLLKILKRKKD